MRITTKALNRSMLHVINNRFDDMARIQERLSTGKRLLRPSDHPVDVANALKLTTKQKELLQFKNNINDGLGFMAVTDSAMESMNILLQKSRELAIQGSSDTLNESERIFINKETEQLFRQMLSLLSTQYKGDYIFSGTQTKMPPFLIENSSADSLDDYNNLKMAYFNTDGMPTGSTAQIFNGFDNTAITNIITGSFKLFVAGTEYVENRDYRIDYEAGNITILNTDLALDVTPGSANYDINQVQMEFDYVTKGKNIYGEVTSNRGEVYREIEFGISMQINISGDELITDSVSGNDLMGTMIRFGQNLLQNNRSGIQSAIEQIDTVFNNILSSQSKNGARINRFETTLDRNEGQYIDIESLRSELEDAEYAETITQFMLTQNIYTAALQSAAKIIQPSLVNFL